MPRTYRDKTCRDCDLNGDPCCPRMVVVAGRGVHPDPSSGLCEPMRRIFEAVEDPIERYGAIDGAHHKAWVIQETVMVLLNLNVKDFEEWLRCSEQERGIPP